jgi:hypothetical protein
MGHALDAGRYAPAMSDDSRRNDPDPKLTHPAAPTASDEVAAEPGPAPTPFDHPFFLPAVCIGFTLWFGYDTYIHPMEEHLDFNYYGFKLVLAASAWYGYLAFCETRDHTVQPWVLPGIFALLTAWLGAETFGLVELPALVEYPAISSWGFRLSAAMIPLSALREWMRVRRKRAADATA